MSARFTSFGLVTALLIMVASPVHGKIVRIYTGKLNINTASVADFTRLPGIGEVTAFRIVKERERREKFKDARELKVVKGISARVYEGLNSYVAVSGESNLKVFMDLNSVTMPLLLGIPGMTEGEARSILNYRKAKGSFAKVEDLRQVPGIGEKRYSELREWLAVARR
jgi:competence protein ComEA